MKEGKRRRGGRGSEDGKGRREKGGGEKFIFMHI